MQWVWFGNLVLVILTLFSVERIITKDNAVQTLEQEVGLSEDVAIYLVEQLPFETLQEIREAGTLAGANLEHAELSGVDLSGVNLAGTRFKGADLSYAQFTNSILDRADLRGASLPWANFDGASLAGTRLQDAYLSIASFTGAHLQNASLWNARADGASFNNANLNRAYLVGATMQGATFEGAGLTQAYLYGTDFTEANTLMGAYFDYTFYNSETIFPSYMDPSSYGGLRESELSGSDFFTSQAEQYLSDYLAGGSVEAFVNLLQHAPAYEVDSFLATYKEYIGIPEELFKQIEEQVQ